AGRGRSRGGGTGRRGTRPPPQRFGAINRSPVLNWGGKTIFASPKGISGFVYWRNSMGGVHCCQYGPSPCEKLIVPFQPSNVLLRSALTRGSPVSLLASLSASATSATCA